MSRIFLDESCNDIRIAYCTAAKSTTRHCLKLGKWLPVLRSSREIAHKIADRLPVIRASQDGSSRTCRSDRHIDNKSSPSHPHSSKLPLEPDPSRNLVPGNTKRSAVFFPVAAIFDVERESATRHDTTQHLLDTGTLIARLCLESSWKINPHALIRRRGTCCAD